jgi:chaperonin cofactor prefoldin
MDVTMFDKAKELEELKEKTRGFEDMVEELHSLKEKHESEMQSLREELQAAPCPNCHIR